MTSKALTVRDFTKIPGALSDDKLSWVFPTVNSCNMRKQTTFWRVYVRLHDSTGADTLANVNKTVNDASVPSNSTFVPSNSTFVPSNSTFVPLDGAYFDSATVIPAHLHGWIKIDSGVVGMKTKISVPTVITAGKNIGKASATNQFTQALRDAYALYNKQLQKSHALDTADLYPPMLAQNYKDQKAAPAITRASPAYLQRKYNGLRAVAFLRVVAPGRAVAAPTEQVVMYSRKRKEYDGLAHIRADIEQPLRDYYVEGQVVYLDGELYAHGESLQDISGWARKGDPDRKLRFKVYDCFVVELGGAGGLPCTRARMLSHESSCDEDLTAYHINAAYDAGYVSTRMHPTAYTNAYATALANMYGGAYGGAHGDPHAHNSVRHNLQGKPGYLSPAECRIQSRAEPLGMLYSARLQVLNDVFESYAFEHADLAETWIVESAADVQPLYEQFIAEQYEGAMLRLNARYEFSYSEYHSKQLLKFKPALDHEFRIVGWETGLRGKAAEALMIICETDGVGADGKPDPAIPKKQFPVTPAMTLPERVALSKKMAERESNGKTHFENAWLGKRIVVTFDEYSRDRVPQRARTMLQARADE